MSELEEDNNLNSNPKNTIEVGSNDEDLRRISEAKKFLLLLYPDIQEEEEKEKEKLSPEKKDSLYFSPVYEPTKEDVEKRKENIKKSYYELRKLPEATTENNIILKKLEERAKNPEIEKPKNLKERFDQLLADQIYIKRFSDEGLSKKYGREILKIQKERYPDVQAQYRLPSFLTTVKEYYQERGQEEKLKQNNGKTVEDIVFKAMERMEMLGDSPDSYYVANGIAFSDPSINKIPAEEFIKLGTTDDLTWGSYIEELKNIPYIRKGSIRFWDYTVHLKKGLDEEQKEQLVYLKKYFSCIYTTKEEDKDEGYYPIISDLLSKRESLDSFKKEQGKRIHDHFSAYHISDNEDKDEIAFRFLSLKHGIDLYDNAYDVFPYRKKLKDMILESDRRDERDPKLIDEQFKLGKMIDSVALKNLYPSEQEAILDTLTEKGNEQMIRKVLLYPQGGLDISGGILALRSGSLRNENSTILKKDFIDSINFSLSSFENKIIDLSQRVEGLEIRNSKEIEELYQSRDTEKIGALASASFLDSYLIHLPSKEQIKTMLNFEDGKYSLNEKFFEYAYGEYFGDGNKLIYNPHPFKEAITFQDIKNPEAKTYWEAINQLFSSSYETQAKNLLRQSIEIGFDYKKILNKYINVDEEQVYLNSEFYYEVLLSSKYWSEYYNDLQYRSSFYEKPITHARKLIRDVDIERIENIEDRLFISFLKEYHDFIPHENFVGILSNDGKNFPIDNNTAKLFFERYITTIESDGQKKYIYNEDFLDFMAIGYPEFILNSHNVLTDELINRIKDPERKELWKFLKNSDPNVSYLLCKLFIIYDLETPSYETLSEYTNIIETNSEKKRLPNAEFFKNFIAYEKEKLVNNANKIFTTEILDSFPQADGYFWEKFLKINDSVSKDSLLNYYSTSKNLDLEEIKSVFALTERILNSPSAEIIKLKDNIIKSLSSKDKSLEESIADYEVLENIFVKNNSPVAISRWRVFNSLYLDDLIDNSSSLKISPIFRLILSNEQYSRDQKKGVLSSIIQNDLLNISKDSVDENLYTFLSRLKEGTEALSFYDSFLQEGYSDGEILGSLGEKEKEYLNKSLDIFFTASSRSSHNEGISSRVTELRALLDIGKGQPLTLGIYKSYILHLVDNPTGEISIDIEKILSNMLSIQEITHQRGLKYAKEGVSIKKGDLLKNVSSLRGIIDNGIYARDFLGAIASQDATPYDTDTVMVNGEVLTFSQGIKDYAIREFGDITLVIRDKGQFNTPSEKDVSSNSKYELIHSQKWAENHYGIRTGIATTEIDYIVISEDLHGDVFSDIKFQIASKGIYIPVVNRNGEIIYSPQEYEIQRETFAGVPGIAYKPYTVDTTSSRLDPTIRYLQEKVIEDREKTNRISQNLQRAIEAELIKRNLLFENSITGLAGVRIEHIGSTSRSTHLVGASDFDFSILMDRSQLSNLDSNGKIQLINDVIASVGTIEQNGQLYNVGDNTTQMVGAKIKLNTGDVVEFDLAITDKGTNINGSNSHELVINRLNDIREKEGEEKYNYVISNILIAKKVLKEYKCYKKGFKEGGLGGIGIENWILQHHGNFEKAANAFLQEATSSDGTQVGFNTFTSRYTVYDPGKDIRTGENDNFVRNNMNESGYRKMVEALTKFKDGEIDVKQLFSSN